VHGQKRPERTDVSGYRRYHVAVTLDLTAAKRLAQSRESIDQFCRETRDSLVIDMRVATTSKTRERPEMLLDLFQVALNMRKLAAIAGAPDKAVKLDDPGDRVCKRKVVDVGRFAISSDEHWLVDGAVHPVYLTAAIRMLMANVMLHSLRRRSLRPSGDHAGNETQQHE
jgi:hypothetical protein